MRRIALACATAIACALSTQAESLDTPQGRDPSSARRGAITDQSLTIAVGKKSGTEQSGEVADSLSGGPDFWEVTGVGKEGLSLREEASLRAKLIMHFPNGTVLRNLGCKERYRERWCRVERANNPSPRGWVRARHLRESAGAK